MKRIDAHTHIYPEAIADKACVNLGKFYNFKVHGKGTESDLFSQLISTGFDGAFILGVATNPHQVKSVNDGIASAVANGRKKGLEIYGFAGMHQDYDNAEAEVERAHEDGLVGFKLHPDIQRVDIDDRRLYRLYEAIEGRMPLVLHMGDDRAEYRYSEPKKLQKIARDFPRLHISASHLGGYKAWDEAKCLYGLDNIWYDLSSALWAMTPERAAELIKACGLERVMYGSDYPVYNLADYHTLFKKLSLPEESLGDIYYENAKRFIKVD